MNFITVIYASFVMFAGATLQSYAGFGFGLLVLPILLFLNFDFQTAVVIVVIGSAVQKIIGVRYFRKYFGWHEITPLFFSGVVGLPIGVFFLYKATFLSQSAIKQLIGFIIISVLIFRKIGYKRKYKKVSKKWGYITGFVSGILNGFANIGGPPVVLWVLSHRWRNEKMRAMVIALSLTFVPFQLGIMTAVFKEKMISAVIYSVELIPPVLLGSRIGLKLGDRLSEKMLTRFMEILLMIIAILAIIKPLIKYLKI